MKYSFLSLAIGLAVAAVPAVSFALCGDCEAPPKPDNLGCASVFNYNATNPAFAQGPLTTSTWYFTNVLLAYSTDKGTPFNTYKYDFKARKWVTTFQGTIYGIYYPDFGVAKCVYKPASNFVATTSYATERSAFGAYMNYCVALDSPQKGLVTFTGTSQDCGGGGLYQ